MNPSPANVVALVLVFFLVVISSSCVQEDTLPFLWPEALHIFRQLCISLILEFPPYIHTSCILSSYLRRWICEPPSHLLLFFPQRLFGTAKRKLTFHMLADVTCKNGATGGKLLASFIYFNVRAITERRYRARAAMMKLVMRLSLQEFPAGFFFFSAVVNHGSS